MDLPKDYTKRGYRMPSIRYHDTSFIIYRKWLKAQDELAFPTVHQYVSKNVKDIDQPDHSLSEHEHNNSTTTNNNKFNSEVTERQNDQRCRERFDQEKCGRSNNDNNGDDEADYDSRNKMKLEKKPEENNNEFDHETITLQIIEPLNNVPIDTGKKDSFTFTPTIDKINHDVIVDVDVHRSMSNSNNSNSNNEIIIIEEDKSTKDKVPELELQKEHDKQLAIIDKQETTSLLTNDSQVLTLDESDAKSSTTLNSISSRKKNYINYSCYSPISTTSISSTDDPDEVMVDYSMVDLRKKGHIYPVSDHQLFAKTNDDQMLEPIPKSLSFPIQSKHHHHHQESDSLRLHYVTQRILASVLPRRDPRNPTIYRPHNEVQAGPEDKYEKEVISMLEQKHGKNYKVLDLESCISVVTLERLCELCKMIDQWLGSGEEKVIILQDRDGRQRLGVAIAAYLKYLDICASNYTIRRNGISNEDLRVQNTIARNWLDLDIFSMKKFLEDFIGPIRIPSYKRYLQLFSGLLSGKIKMNSSPVRLEFISVESPPSWLQCNRLSPQTEWRSFIKIYEGLQCIYTSDIHIIPITTRNFLYQLRDLRLRGDILIRCYQIISSENNLNNEARELLFSVQFHTCAINSRKVTFTKEELDLACDDPRFPNDHKITLHLGSSTPTEKDFIFQSPLIRTEPSNTLTKGDSAENFDLNSSYHTEGPIDGSLYATILKSSKVAHPNHLSLQRSVSNQESFSQNVISPPPEFSNNKQHYDVIERRSVGSGSPIIRNNIVESNRREISSDWKIVRGQSQARSDYSYVDSSRPGTSQSTYQDKYNTRTTTGNYSLTTQHRHHHLQQQQQQQQQQQTPITFVETYAVVDGGHSRDYQNGRQSVRSPLTLSMDSGISSSGVLNRPPQGSSVSPLSFPSQSSPQEDRHQELDDILSDMLLTVQDIPDFNKSDKQQSVQKIIRNQRVVSSASGNYGLPAKKLNSTSQNNLIPLSTTVTNSSYVVKNRSVDAYDSTSTTTLTPPPSENGRDTPIINTGGSGEGGGYKSTADSIGNIPSLQNHQTLHREKRETHTMINSNSEVAGDQQHLQPHHHGSRHQSSVYPQAVQTSTELITVSENDDNIPYHAREDSQPFTYGNIPPVISNGTEIQDPTMIKTQSGLSSPSLVRKTLGSSQTLRKTTPRNDFEEMLRERREKVMNEKYSIGDNNPSSVDFDKTFDRSYSGDKWGMSSTLRQPNGYHYYNEPLKRSNTLDGFYRSMSTDGISGQTWLQLQQQKLRAKKDQQFRENRRYFEEAIHTELKNRPLRSRANVPRYDGYASDTAAFVDEVDYRRPLHVQMPYRSPEQTYHTITRSTISNTSKERPFTPKRDVYATREESFSSYRSEIDPEFSVASSPRPETPAFPVTPRTPYGLSSNGSVSPALPPKSPTSQRKDLYTSSHKGQLHDLINQNEVISSYTCRRNSNSSNANSEPQEVAPHHVKFVQDSSKYWYKPNLSREEAVNLLRNAVPGTFVVRDSTTFRNAFGLVVRVAHLPPGVVAKGNSDELVRHFLVEPTSRGVRLKGCANEPVFTSLSALVYQHSITPLALPCRLIIPDRDIQATNYQSPAQKQLLTQGAACNVLYLFVCDTESLTGDEAVRRAVYKLFTTKPLPSPTEVHFKVSQQGITLTDNTRQKFFRKHYSGNVISFCGLDPDRHMWSVKSTEGDVPVDKKVIFAFVARRSASSTDNQCHVFCDLSPSQPATAIVSFVNKVLPTEKLVNPNLI